MSEPTPTIGNLAACPFCRGTTLHLSSNGHENHFVTCGDCGAEGPAGASELLAMLLWGNRPVAIEAMGDVSEARAEALEAFFRQLIHNDFCGDDPKDLRNAIAARGDIMYVLKENLRARPALADAARYQEIRSHAGYSLGHQSKEDDLGNYHVSCKVHDGEAVILYEKHLDRFVDHTLTARAEGRTPAQFMPELDRPRPVPDAAAK
jgi:hypothetical protein